VRGLSTLPIKPPETRLSAKSQRLRAAASITIFGTRLRSAHCAIGSSGRKWVRCVLCRPRLLVRGIIRKQIALHASTGKRDDRKGARERGQSFCQSRQTVKTRSTGRALVRGKNRGSRSHDPLLLVGAFGSDSRAKKGAYALASFAAFHRTHGGSRPTADGIQDAPGDIKLGVF